MLSILQFLPYCCSVLTNQSYLTISNHLETCTCCHFNAIVKSPSSTNLIKQHLGAFYLCICYTLNTSKHKTNRNLQQQSSPPLSTATITTKQQKSCFQSFKTSGSGSVRNYPRIFPRPPSLITKPIYFLQD